MLVILTWHDVEALSHLAPVCQPLNVAMLYSAVYGYDTKAADSEGLALGTVTLPWTFTALLITDLLKKGSSGKYRRPRINLNTNVLASIQQMCSMCHDTVKLSHVQQ